MAAERYTVLTVVQVGSIIQAAVRLTDNHNDGSREEVVYPLTISAVEDAPDLESWCKDVLAAAIEVL